MAKEGTCKFCGQRKKLVKAHIIPRHFYFDYVNEKYRSVDPMDGSWKQCQCGLYDNDILCKDCDGRVFKQFDDAAYEILLKDISQHIIKQRFDFKLYHFKEEEFDFSLLRKFFVSVLWRASISKLEDFKDIRLGKYQDIAKEIIENKNEYLQFFNFFIFKFPDNKIFSKIIYLQQMHFGKCVAYQLVMSSFCITIIVKNVMTFETLSVFKPLIVTNEDLYILESQEVYDNFNNGLLKIAKNWNKYISNKK